MPLNENGPFLYEINYFYESNFIVFYTFVGYMKLKICLMLIAFYNILLNDHFQIL